MSLTQSNMDVQAQPGWITNNIIQPGEAGQLVFPEGFSPKWNNIQRSLFIESAMVHIPILTPFYFQHVGRKHVIVDGAERISACLDFQNDKFALEGLEFRPELNGKKCSELHLMHTRAFHTASICVVYIKGNYIPSATATEKKVL